MIIALPEAAGLDWASVALWLANSLLLIVAWGARLQLSKLNGRIDEAEKEAVEAGTVAGGLPALVGRALNKLQTDIRVEMRKDRQELGARIEALVEKLESWRDQTRESQTSLHTTEHRLATLGNQVEDHEGRIRTLEKDK